ncbi:MAG: cytochrome c family protein [Paracoccaceae bacterium]
MDTMTATKIVGGVCGSLLVFLLVKWGAEVIYHGASHGESEAAYVIEVEEVIETATTEEVAGPTFAEVFAMADAAAGEKVFKKCKACHKLEDGVNGSGPHLFGIIDRAKAGVEDFSYSAVLTGLGGNWTPEDLNAFLTKPKEYAPGTKMSFGGLKSEKDRANLIAYLATIGG